MSRTYRTVTRKERRQGKRSKSNYRPEIPSRRMPVFVNDAVKLGTSFFPENYEVSDGFPSYAESMIEDMYDDAFNRLGLVRVFTRSGLQFWDEGDFDFPRYSRKNHPVQTVPKIDWHNERWRNGRKSRKKVTTVEAEDLRARSEIVNSRIDNALANGRNPFRRNTYNHSRNG